MNLEVQFEHLLWWDETKVPLFRPRPVKNSMTSKRAGFVPTRKPRKEEYERIRITEF